ncbi:sensor histidine kinase [Salinigranum rubrum]|uniref:histidine kinase n=2 Tax=Salinigranum rubrum TaxID=755307 RepID=A0A2I8VPE7_9EURY|nr:sensor histidine kinase [Salinigranum rubrum]
MQALDRAAELLDHLQTLAREEKETLDPEPTDLRTVTEAAWCVVETDGAELGVEGDTTIVADRSRFQELLENLFTNAVAHVGTDVTVRVGPLEDGGFYVADDGPGIAEDDRDDVFEMGYSTSPDGMGFGLAICEQIANAHGWVIEVDSGSDGGARFEISAVDRCNGVSPDSV